MNRPGHEADAGRRRPRTGNMTAALLDKPSRPSPVHCGQRPMTAAITLPVRALLLGERLETRGLEREDTIYTAPLTLRLGDDRIAVLFRYGGAVFAGLS